MNTWTNMWVSALRPYMLAMAMLLWPVHLMAASMTELTCSHSQETFGPLTSGFTRSGEEYTIVYSPTQKRFDSIKTRNVDGWDGNLDTGSPAYQAAGHKDFMGEERPYYILSKDNEAYAYAGPKCPICGQGTLKSRTVGFVD